MKSDVGWIKYNIDAYYFFLRQTGVTTLVCCFDNHIDQFVVAVTTSQRALLSTVKDEAIAILRAMEEACARDFVCSI
jgi:hypothetical protein